MIHFFILGGGQNPGTPRSKYATEPYIHCISVMNLSFIYNRMSITSFAGNEKVLEKTLCFFRTHYIYIKSQLC